MELIGWTLIGICCFYIIRNLYVGSVMFPAANHIVLAHNAPFEKRPFLKVHPKHRNYYLIVLNPLWWRFLDVYQNDEDGRKLKYRWNELNKTLKFKKN